MLEMWVEQPLETHSRCRVSFVSFCPGSIRPGQGRRAGRRVPHSPLKGSVRDRAAEPRKHQPNVAGVFLVPGYW